MALIRSPAVTLAAATLLLSALLVAAHGFGVGGRVEIRDVESNKEVQELGRFSVEEFNRRQRRNHRTAAGEEWKFSEVLEGQKQIVSGIKYYLKVSAIKGGENRIFDSVVVVKPWIHSRQLLNFAPSTDQQLHL